MQTFTPCADVEQSLRSLDLKRLGQPFEQARSNPFVAQGGTGLGLALIKALSESHGGGATIESVEGDGTTVSVDFAARPAARAAA